MASQQDLTLALSTPTYHQYQTAVASQIELNINVHQNTQIVPAIQNVNNNDVPPANNILNQNNTEYEGERDDKNRRSGFGTLRFITTPNAYYKGEWVEDKMEGQGEYCWGDGHRYCGSFKDNKQHGIGVYFWPTGGKYFGSWSRDKMNGQGTYTRNDGVVYTGQWRDDHQYGEGLKIIPVRVCYGESEKMSRMCIYKEYWTADRCLAMHKEILKFPDVYRVQKMNRFADLDVITVDRSPEEEAIVRRKRCRDEYENNNSSAKKRKKLKLSTLQN
ncbi:phosphatidylinositol phosphate kinase [Acrasis kona]|uniref:Phosphatidylinositol phosphate kinase n=1 Tax=Acrasis kona TaxID=1008807 RepID=A0AAW2ZPN4_9EUKA